jgi:hypothetical protein
MGYRVLILHSILALHEGNLSGSPPGSRYERRAQVELPEEWKDMLEYSIYSITCIEAIILPLARWPLAPGIFRRRERLAVIEKNNCLSLNMKEHIGFSAVHILETDGHRNKLRACTKKSGPDIYPFSRRVTARNFNHLDEGRL